MLSPAIALTPNFALTVDEAIAKCPGGAEVTISSASSLVLDGDIRLHSLELDGALSIIAAPGATVHVRGCAVRNAGWALAPVEPGTAPKPQTIRGFHIADRSTGLHVRASEPGVYELSGDGTLSRVE